MGCKALRRLLAGSGLVGTVDDKGGVVLRPALPPAASRTKVYLR